MKSDCLVRFIADEGLKIIPGPDVSSHIITLAYSFEKRWYRESIRVVSRPMTTYMSFFAQYSITGYNRW